jgi:gliding motility-associated-like protein
MRVFTNIFLFIFLCFAAAQADAQSVGGSASGAATYCSFSNSGFISLTGFTGSVLNWEFSTNAGASWNSIPNTTSNESYFNLSQSTCYRAIVQNGAFPPDTSTIACITVFEPSAGGTISGGGTFCGNPGSGSLALSGNIGNPLYWAFSTDNGLTWTSITDTTSILGYSSITQNTIYQAVVQNGASCPSDTSSQAAFTINPVSSAGVISGNDTVCSSINSGMISLSGYAGTISGWMYSADLGISWTSIANATDTLSYLNLSQATLYEAVVQNGSCPADTSTFVLINIFAPPAVSAGNDTTISPGQSLVLNGSGAGSASWSPATGLSNTGIFSPLGMPSNSTTYTLTVTDTNGCINSDDVTVTVSSRAFDGMVSNLFTPNGDGINDTWYIEGIENFPGNGVFVYNIYGNKVFEKKGYNNDWKGTYNGADLPEGTYYYILKFDDESKVIKGSLDILRNK